MKTKISSRLNEPTTTDRLWFNQAIATYGQDFFSVPTYNPDQFELKGKRAIYPPLPERLSWGKVKLIQKHGNPHPSLWINRVDLFLITVESDQKWERVFSINLAGIDRAAHLRAEAQTKERLPKGATVNGQTYWLLTSEVAADLLFELDGDIAFVSPFQHHLKSGELEPTEPLSNTSKGDLLFVRGNARPLSPGDRRWMRGQARLQEHEKVVDIHLDGYGFIHS